MRLLSKYIEKVTEYGVFASILIVIEKLIKISFFPIGKYLCRVDQDKIVFLTFSGRYECNPKWICEKMIQKKMPVKYIWGITRDLKIGTGDFPEQIQTVRRNTVKFLWHLSTARIIIDNNIGVASLGYRVKKSQCLIETWHGSLGIKRFDADVNKDQKWIRRAVREGRMTSYIISNSSFESEIYKNSFWNPAEIWKFGHARNDILLNGDMVYCENMNKKICEKFNIPLGRKLCMYAPTFRDDKDLSPYTINFARLKVALSDKFGGEWVILVRFHLRVKELLSDNEFPQDVYNVSEYHDIQELLCIIDVGITDYSSWICEYMLTRKPGFLFATDTEQYEIKDREFLLPLTELPFPFSANEDELITNISLFDEKEYVSRCDNFLKEKGSVDDGNAAERIVNAIQKII